MIAPTEAQCDSPYVVTRKSVPKVLIADLLKVSGRRLGKRRAGARVI